MISGGMHYSCEDSVPGGHAYMAVWQLPWGWMRPVLLHTVLSGVRRILEVGI